MKRLIRMEGIPSFFAGFYSFFIGKSSLVREIYKDIAEELNQNIFHGRILDVGTGPGFLPLEIARKSLEYKIFGIDISKGMIKIANKNLKYSDFSKRVTFINANASIIPFKDECFDFVVSTFSFHHWAEPLECLKEIGRVLKKGGEAWIYDIRRDTSRETNIKIRRRYGFFLYFILQFVKLHSSVTMEKIERIPYRIIGFSNRLIEDREIILKIRFIK